MEKEKQESTVWPMLSLAWGLGYTIAIPLVLFAFIGRSLDHKFGSSPWLFILGVILSMVASTIGIYVKTVRILTKKPE